MYASIMGLRRTGSKLRWVARVLAAGSAWALGACSGAHEQAHAPTVSVRHGTVAATANVPALLGASIDGLRHRLGQPRPLPAGFSDPSMLVMDTTELPDSAVAFRLGGLLLIASYNAHTRQVRDFLLLGQHEDSLMGRASLRPNAADYLVLPVFREDNAGRLLGLRIVPTK